jgi:membrane fusion protein (multidrug efflux system)
MPLLKPGMFGRVSLVVDEKEDQLVVPSRALMVTDNASSDARKVYVVDEKGIARERMIRVGVRNDSWYEVLNGLKVKDRVVLRGQYDLRDQDAVEVLSELKLNDKGEAEK